jgi:hypothetical protein
MPVTPMNTFLNKDTHGCLDHDICGNIFPTLPKGHPQIFPGLAISIDIDMG